MAREPDPDLKSRIDQAALRLFAERGADATPVPMIAAAARVAVGSLYRYYPCKEELVRRLYAENYARLASRLESAAATARTCRGKVAAMVESICALCDAEWDLARFLLLEQHVRLQSYEAANPVDIVLGVVQDGICDGALRPMDPLLAAALVMGPVVQAVTFRTYGRVEDSLTSLAPGLVAGIWAAISSGDAAAQPKLSKKPSRAEPVS